MHEKTLLRHLRKMRDLTLREVSSQTRIHTSSLSLIESGRLVPTDWQRNALVGYFGKPIHELLGPAPHHEAA